MHLGRALAAAVLALTMGLTTVLATSPAAVAAGGSAPVTVADRLEGRAGSVLEVEPLGNDSDADGDALALCRLGTVPPGMMAEIIEDSVIVIASQPGTYTFDYYACDFEQLTRGTITVVVTPAAVISLRIRKLPQPGQLRVVNRSAFQVSFAWGSVKEDKADGSRWIRPGRAVVIKVRRPSIVWAAANLRQDVFKVGAVRGIRLPKGTKALAPGAPKPGMEGAFAGRAMDGWK